MAIFAHSVFILDVIRPQLPSISIESQVRLRARIIFLTAIIVQEQYNISEHQLDLLLRRRANSPLGRADIVDTRLRLRVDQYFVNYVCGGDQSVSAQSRFLRLR